MKIGKYLKSPPGADPPENPVPFSVKSSPLSVENSAIDDDVSSIDGEKSKTIETVSKSKLGNYDIECKKTENIRSDEGEEEYIKSI